MPTSRSNENLQRGYQLILHFQNACFTFAFRLLLADPDPGPRDLDSCNLILLLKVICMSHKRSHGRFKISFRLALPSAVSSSILSQNLLTDKEEKVYYVFTKRTSLERMRVGYESETEFNIEWQIWTDGNGKHFTFCRKTRPETKNRVSILTFRTLCVNITKTFSERRFMTFAWSTDDGHAYVKMALLYVVSKTIFK